MQEYFGESAQKYGQPQDKFYTLFPALEKALPQAEKGQSLIDLGCGTGVLFELAVKKGYDYTGVDISADMLLQAQTKNPNGVFLEADVTKPLAKVKKKFDVVIANMLFPSLESKTAFSGVFSVAKSLLADSGIFILTAGHPCFDGYMQKHFFNREDIKTNFSDYFASGEPYTVERALDGVTFAFRDSHWTLTDYFENAKKVGMRVMTLDECPILGEPPKAVREKFLRKGSPSYLVLVFSKTLEQS